MDHTVLPANYTNACLYLVSVHQTALPLTCDNVRLIAAYYSFIDPERMKGKELACSVYRRRLQLRFVVSSFLTFCRTRHKTTEENFLSNVTVKSDA